MCMKPDGGQCTLLSICLYKYRYHAHAALNPQAPFCPTNEKLPAANHLSFASFTRCAAVARFVNSKPCEGVTLRLVAVPDELEPEREDCCADRVRFAVRSLFALDIFAAKEEFRHG